MATGRAVAVSQRLMLRPPLIIGLVAVLCGTADAGKKRRGTFAAYIDPAAPADPPRPVPPRPKRLSIVLLIDRSAGRYGLWTAQETASDVAGQITEDDQIAVMAFDTSVDLVLKPVWGSDREEVGGAVFGLKAAEGHDVAAALDEARSYVAGAPGRKVIMLVTNGAKPDDHLERALTAIRDANIALIVVGTHDPDELTLSQIADWGHGRLIFPDRDHGAPSVIEAEMTSLHGR